MNKLISIALLAAFVGYASATCPNLCNGHGSCGMSDRCKCFANWQGGDCSERVCPYGLAWVDAPTAADTAHGYAECSNKGICDRSTGLCQCYEGYTGKGCRRSTCPNDCSGHGTCYYIEELSTFSNSNEFYNIDGDADVTTQDFNPLSSVSRIVVDHDTMVATYNKWDVSKIQACVCDPYYEGTDCSLRMCPRGDNILTDGEQAQVQRIKIGQYSDTAEDAEGEITLTFFDLYGGVWETRKIALGSTLAANIETALLSLPNAVVPSVSCVLNDDVPADEFVDCTFDADINAGSQHLLQVNHVGCNRPGCTPMYAGISNDDVDTAGALLTVNVEEVRATGTSKVTESALCSEHGVCDSESGLCKCFSGYWKENCNSQTVLV